MRDVAPPGAEPSASSSDAEAFDIITRKGVSGTARYEIRRRVKFDFQKKLWQFKALFRLHQDVAAAYDGVRTKHVSELNATNLEAARAVTKPSLVRYGIYTCGCILIDIASAALAVGDVTGVGLVVTIALGILITMFMWLYGRVILGRRLKRLKAHRQELRLKVGRISNDIQLVRRQYVQVSRYVSGVRTRFPAVAARLSTVGSRIGRLASKSRFAVRGIGVITRVLRWKPLVWIGENIPAIRAWPFWTIAAVATYIEHRGEYGAAQELLLNYNEGKREVIGITDETYQSQLMAIEQEMTGTSIAMEEDRAIATA